MPLIQDLKNPVIRERHWIELKNEINKDFDAHSDNFTLADVFTLDCTFIMNLLQQWEMQIKKQQSRQL